MAVTQGREVVPDMVSSSEEEKEFDMQAYRRMQSQMAKKREMQS